ncbi:protein IMPAIRED IN BABA-INDUCED STERILITY 1-like [Cucurbita moschata]|uniref:Protein IMPAIRED IN BABA-INDUCED STERILITY 1-like n=1 Tax=Cucurbita moschata TaxID=3662 RepID=A0A6J1GAG7_CUCMO|nr:protein IMPAIRED IN BABA-INDUCED STERILITY 1-like [Cucurbita moschata]XP_022948891.1 protein IMPAIRED IN BABA-INDUCED STERILITY 1-like [Cucurbita moschata]
MGCVNTKHAVSVTPAFDHSGVFRDNESTAIGNSGRSRLGFGEIDKGSKPKSKTRTKGSRDFNGVASEFGESGRASSNGGGNDTLSFRIGNFNKYMESEQVAAGWPAWLCAVAGEAIQGWVPLRSDAYEKLEKIGQGTYSTVFRARELETGRIVALKKVRFDNFEPESVRFMAREIMILRRLDHPNIIKLEGLITSRLSCSIYLVFEYMDHDITGLLSCPDITFSESQIKCYMKQLLSGLEHCHSRGVMHRDIKGSNLLVNNEGVLKVADFGLANFCNSGHRQPLTSRVVTLWYRPPELLLGSTDYNASVDLWSVGCVFAELLVGKPILQGRTEVEQLHKIFKLCGSPPDEYWKKSKLPHATLFKPQHPYNNCLRQTFKDYPSTTVNLLETLLSVEPYKRGVASSALTSEYFSTKPHACDPSSMPIYPPSKEIDAKQREESRRKKGSGRTRGLDSRRLTRKHLGISKLAPAEDLSVSARDLHKISINAQNLKEEKVIKGGEVKKVSNDKLEESMHVKNASQGDIPFSGPLQVSTSSGFAWARRRRDEASIRSHSRSISRGHVINGLDHSAILHSRSNVDSKFHEKGDMLSISCSSSKGRESNERSKVVIRNQWGKFERPDSFDASDEYHSQDFSVALYLQDEMEAKRSNLSYQDQVDKVEYSGPLLSQSSRVDELLDRHERHIRQTVRRSWFQRGKN